MGDPVWLDNNVLDKALKGDAAINQQLATYRKAGRQGRTSSDIAVGRLSPVNIPTCFVRAILRAAIPWSSEMLARAALIMLATCLSTGIAAAQEKVTFPAIDGPGGPPTVLSGLLYRPAGTGPFPAVVGLHGCGGLLVNDKPAPLIAQWGEMLAAEGYMVLLPDSHASRGHAHNLCALVGDARPVQWNRERSRDAYAGLRYLKGRSDVRPNSVVVFGQSAGAAPILHILSSEVERADWKGSDEFRATILFYPPCQLALDTLPGWKARLPSLLLVGDEDDWTPAAQCKQLVPASMSDQIESHYYPGAYHIFDHPNMPKTTLTAVKLPPNGQSPTIATDPVARADAIARVKKFLAAKGAND